MATVTELSAPYGNFMLGPRPGPGVCQVCLDLTAGARLCAHCDADPAGLDAVLPISYSVAHEQLHHALAGYKRAPWEVARHLQRELAAVLWRFLAGHERCLARAAGTDRFDTVTTVPSSTPARATSHPLITMVAELVGPTRARHRGVLARTAAPAHPHTFTPGRFQAIAAVDGRSVLLIDDTWTTGANARSAATALKASGARTVAAVVIGRHLHREYAGNDHRLRGLATPFDWERCALH